MWFLLCALVQVASRTSTPMRAISLSSALCTCASCFTRPETHQAGAQLLLCALVQVASQQAFINRHLAIASALCTCASCFKINALSIYKRFASALCTCASCFLVVMALDECVSSPSALCTCASCFGKTAQFFASGSRSNLHRCAVTYHI